jgi:uncharacterized protein (TIGR00288 family)
MSENSKVFALLIDGDNISTEIFGDVWKILEKHGDLRICKVFHNKTTMEQWEQIANEYGIEPIWVPNNIKNKNSVDIALVMEAMILLYERKEIEGFCIVSSDSDYTRLARHLKTHGKFVLGIGKTQTRESFRNACTEFIDIDKNQTFDIQPQLSRELTIEQIVTTDKQTFTETSNATSVQPEEISEEIFFNLFVEAYQETEQVLSSEDGWVPLKNVKETMTQLNPEFTLSTRKLAEKLKLLAIAYANQIEIYEDLESKPVLHRVRLLNELERFIATYNYAKDKLQPKDKTEWVNLATIGSAFRHLFPYYNSLIYRGVRSSQLQRVLEKILVDYPNVFELHQNNSTVYIRKKRQNK